jgi:cyclohexanecarboxylate-CoA ligase
MESNLDDEPQFGADALAIRRTLRFRAEHVQREVEAGRWTSDTVASWLERWARATPEAIAVASPGCMPLAYAAALEQAERLATALAALGVRRGDVVTVQLPSTVEFIIIYYAVARLGGVLSTLHMPYGAAEAEPILRHSRARAVFCGAASEKSDPPARFTTLARDLPDLRHVISVGPPRPGVLSFETLIAGADRSPLPQPLATDPAVMCYTSGTSAAPKAVPHSFQSLLANPRQCLPVFDLKSGDRVLSASPLTHAFGLFVANAALMAGAILLPLPAFIPLALATALETERPSHLFVAPPHVAALLRAGLLEGRNLSGLRLAVVSGSYCPPELKRALEDRLPGGKVIELWGMTETFAVLLGDPGRPDPERHEWIGRPTAGSEARVVDIEGKPAPDNVEGELQVRGCSVFAGYFDNAFANDGLFSNDDWFRTGDLAVMSATGHFRITGRTKDLVNRGGVKINPSDVEALIDRHEAVVQSAIIPMPDPILGERACCFVVLKPGMTLSLDGLCAWLERQGVAKLKWPERLVPIAEMPMTPTRKVIKGALAKLLRE